MKILLIISCIAITLNCYSSAPESLQSNAANDKPSTCISKDEPYIPCYEDRSDTDINRKYVANYRCIENIDGLWIPYSIHRFRIEDMLIDRKPWFKDEDVTSTSGVFFEALSRYSKIFESLKKEDESSKK